MGLFDFRFFIAISLLLSTYVAQSQNTASHVANNGNFVRNGSHANTVQSGSAYLLKSDGYSFRRHTYLKFNMSARSYPVSAILRLRVSSSSTSSASNKFKVHSTSDGWNESSITWNNRPSLGSELGRITASTSSSWKTLDVTDAVRTQMRGDRTVSFGLQHVITWNSQTMISIGKRTSSTPPTLELTYDRLTYSGGNYNENLILDATINNSLPLTVSLAAETFNDNDGNLKLEPDQFSIPNLPPGLTPVFSLSSNKRVATLTLIGKAINHDNEHSVANLQFIFTDAAFTSSYTADIQRSGGGGTAFVSNASITFGFGNLYSRMRHGKRFIEGEMQPMEKN